MEKINVRNIYIELLNKIKNVQGVDKDYVDGLIELVDNEITALDSDINAITSVIPESASVSNQLATVNDIPDVTQIELDLETLTASVSAIDLLIPSGASSSNQLATVNDIPAIPTVINPVYLEFTVDSWTLVSGTYRAGFQIQGVLNYTLPHFLFIRPLSEASETAAEKAAFDLITKSTLEGDAIPPVNSSLILFADSEPTTNFKIGVIAWKTE